MASKLLRPQMVLARRQMAGLATKKSEVAVAPSVDVSEILSDMSDIYAITTFCFIAVKIDAKWSQNCLH